MFDFLPIRPRRNRRCASLRDLVREVHLGVEDLICPLFVKEGNGKEEIPLMPNQFRFSIDYLLEEAKLLSDLGIRGIALFPIVPSHKKFADARESWNSEGLIPETIRRLKKELPSLMVITDVALDPYSSDGHDGVVKICDNGDIKVLNDETVEFLCKQAICQAEAGADIVAPSDMMDGRVGAIRRALDGAGFCELGILSYAVKYASCYYGPFRSALDSAPKAGDKKTYQMDIANVREAVREVLLDDEEGADIVMVKPAGFYLDVIAQVREVSSLPLAAYQVSGEYAMLQSMFAWASQREVITESLVAIKRAGADMIFTYFAKQFAEFERG